MRHTNLLTTSPLHSKEVLMSEETQKAKEDTSENTLKLLDGIREETGQISELMTEENMLVKEFHAALLRIMRPLTENLPVSTSVFPQEWGKISQATLDYNGQLLVLFSDGKMKSIDLKEQRHRELLLKVTYNLMPTLKRLITSHREKIETRVKLMSSITKELQKTAEAFSIEHPKQTTS
jgi:hypothetical protein